ncbi:MULTISPECIES: DUF4956 domain-containing protein [unclassified Moritella]|uniref:DUF4956 domain-containing protein n=1 Tax=unclassified Moritella TaxID=2637987 RepID=UPI001BA85F1A|nr:MULTISPECIES: DUF4956 domain-containing protein [unclassified Moritella]QUM87003.1 DUF4956 domain-containing protein [Moritella sp. 28]QUM91239.1 DUF4956 domain-containing protein [Moritella sp. 36]
MEQINPAIAAFLPNEVQDMFFPFASVMLAPLLMNLVIGFALSWVIGAHFRYFASSFCNRQDFSRLFPLLMLTVILIISIVKASLALALGLVGALSIVRFRTPIKEPEELLYLFLNIGIAVALGAGQTTAAITACITTLILVSFIRHSKTEHHGEKGIFLSLRHQHEGENQVSISELQAIFTAYTTRSDLRRYDHERQLVEATFFISFANSEHLDNLFEALEHRYPGVALSLLEQHNIAGV